MSKRTQIAKLCREQRDQAFEKAKGGATDWEKCRVLTKCAVLFGVLAVILDEDESRTAPPGEQLYRRDRNRFVKVD
jgi:hypothetical protein